MYYFLPSGQLVTREHYRSLHFDELFVLREDLKKMGNARLCDLAWRAGLPWEAPLRFARGQLALGYEQQRNLYWAYLDQDYNIHGPGVPRPTASDFVIKRFRAMMRNAVGQNTPLA